MCIRDSYLTMHLVASVVSVKGQWPRFAALSASNQNLRGKNQNKYKQQFVTVALKMLAKNHNQKHIRKIDNFPSNNSYKFFSSKVNREKIVSVILWDNGCSRNGWTRDLVSVRWSFPPCMEFYFTVVSKVELHVVNMLLCELFTR